ncbi:ecto-NOX disulfide-thiol exchanger 2-like [Lingula anatina]|uniref:Ecto-NOX disulfide-thiol exchanger 2-like n=1 Tax=Lingula anatina TaxID=7574 RepID=A0A1S3HU38_LINAN|nr:ecto-NOX disulfide-thiol exchanger 2-like [Lingula anatina]|eukprot:XP_013388569.1 ecto-NOX disulfide-thiol exchanger 2-like [Lingula anatina]
MSSPFAFLGLNIGTQGMHSGQPPIQPPPPPPGHLNQMMHPAMNNQPLQFNINKNKPPMPMSTEEKEHQEKLVMQMQKIPPGPAGPPGQIKGPGPVPGAGLMDINAANTNQSQMNMHSPGVMGPGMPGPMGQMAGQMTGQMAGPMQFGPMMGDPNMMGWGPMGYGQFGGFMGPMPPMEMQQREPLTFETFKLIPPPPGAPPPSTRERPPGCRTVFVGGFPENCTEEMIRELFESSCGSITSIRMSKKNFAHVRFDYEHFVDAAIALSGYRMQIGEQTDKPNTGRLHVDFAQARDDLYEWECRERALFRERRHQERLEEERLRPPSPPPTIHYSDHEAQALIEKLKDDSTFIKASAILVTWLERGDCNKRTATSFYTMVQSTHSHVRRLLNEKQQHEEEVRQIKEKFRQRFEGILRQMEQIVSVFKAATKQKAWDHFTKAQRKNIDTWKKASEEIKTTQQDEFFKERQETEMDLSDDEESSAKKPKLDNSQVGQLKEDNDSLKCQVEAYKNEMDLVKTEAKNSIEEAEKQIKAFAQALQGMQQQLINANTQRKKDEEEIQRLQAQLGIVDKTGGQKSETAAVELNLGGASVSQEKTSVEETVQQEKDVTSVTLETPSSSIATEGSALNEKEARLIGLISVFLHAHPFGASVDYIWSYLQRCNIIVRRSSEIEDLLERLPDVFRTEMCGVGASIEKRWTFTGFTSKDSGLIIK